MIKLGMKYRDLLTGFEGIASGFCTYITGCNQALIQPRSHEMHKKPDPVWIDEQRLEVIPEDGVFKLPEMEHEGQALDEIMDGTGRVRDAVLGAPVAGAVRHGTGADIEAPKR